MSVIFFLFSFQALDKWDPKVFKFWLFTELSIFKWFLTLFFKHARIPVPRTPLIGLWEFDFHKRTKLLIYSAFGVYTSHALDMIGPHPTNKTMHQTLKKNSHFYRPHASFHSLADSFCSLSLFTAGISWHSPHPWYPKEPCWTVRLFWCKADDETWIICYVLVFLAAILMVLSYTYIFASECPISVPRPLFSFSRLIYVPVPYPLLFAPHICPHDRRSSCPPCDPDSVIIV